MNKIYKNIGFVIVQLSGLLLFLIPQEIGFLSVVKSQSLAMLNMTIDIIGSSGVSVVGALFFLVSLFIMVLPIVGIFICKQKHYYFLFVCVPIISSMLTTIMVSYISSSFKFVSYLLFFIPGCQDMLWLICSLLKDGFALVIALSLMNERFNKSLQKMRYPVIYVLTIILCVCIPVSMTFGYYHSNSFRFAKTPPSCPLK